MDKCGGKVMKIRGNREKWKGKLSWRNFMMNCWLNLGEGLMRNYRMTQTKKGLNKTKYNRLGRSNSSGNQCIFSK